MLANSLRIASASRQVLRQDRELLLFPLMALTTQALIVAATALAAIQMGATRLEPDGTSSVEMTAKMWALYGLGLLAAVSVSVLFTGALTAGSFHRIAGGDPTISSALRQATQRLPALLGWALLTCTAGLVARLAGSKAGRLARVLLGATGVLWQIVAYLAVPAIVVDDLGPIAALRRSATLLRRTWGENLAANAGLGAIAAVLIIPSGPVTAWLAGSDNATVATAAPVTFLAWLVAVVVATTTLNAVYQTALYLYATGQRRVAAFDEAMLASGFRTKPARSVRG